MTQEELVKHLQDCGCVIVREDNGGYFVMRNAITGEMSGVPVPSNPSGHYKTATICQICKKLCVEIHVEGAEAESVVDHVNETIVRAHLKD